MNLEDAVNIAMRFVEDSGGFEEARLKKVRKKGKEWHIIIDVGVLFSDFRNVVIDDESGEITGYEEE